MGRILFIAWLAAALLFGQAPAPGRFVGTVKEIKVDTAEVVVKPDNGPAVTAKLTSDTAVERVDPGAKDLKSAQPMKASDMVVGDRVLVVLMPDAAVLRRIVVMPAVDITKRNEADRADWSKRGISGVVAAKSGNEVTLKMRTMQGESRATVTVAEKTVYRRYAPDSVKFQDAKLSNLAEIGVGDQLRARGQKSADGLNVSAEEIVFGTFQTKAGTVASVNADTREIAIKELGTNKPLVIKLTADTQLKKMPSFGGGPGVSAPAGAGAPPAGATAPPAGAATVHTAPAGGGPMMAGRPGGTFDLAQMIERMPAGKLEDLKPGETLVVSSTKGAKSDELTAITLLTNADGLIRMVTMMAPGGAGRSLANGLNAPSLSGLATGLDGLLPGITP